MSSANVLFLFIMMIGPVLSLVSSSWVLAWLGVELAFFGLIPLMISGKYFSISKEATLKYFCIQALSSALLFVSGMLIFFNFNMYVELIFLLSLCLKLGLFPGHFWVPSIVSGLDWFPCLLLLTWQKIAPLAFLVLCVNLNDMMSSHYFLVLGGLSALVGGMIGNNLHSVRGMIGASSVSHMGWTVLGSISGGMWLYFFLYCGVLFLTLGYLWNSHFLSSISILSLSGIPPFAMFVGKWSVISNAIAAGVGAHFLVLPILGSLLSLVFYLKFMYTFYLNEVKSVLSVELLPLALLNFGGLGYLLMT
uniref:NADH dehydrogenase subunit 2 n=1 Tax=Philine kinglipini TaxID=3030995 RepID=UPI002551D2ED|nr:NADH dehydrogenase subunit 2 [Philine kinglipini]WFG53990.1 NADH dehydrogenase subunit 2 [Philine kinglipini]